MTSSPPKLVGVAPFWPDGGGGFVGSGPAVEPEGGADDGVRVAEGVANGLTVVAAAAVSDVPGVAVVVPIGEVVVEGSAVVAGDGVEVSGGNGVAVSVAVGVVVGARVSTTDGALKVTSAADTGDAVTLKEKKEALLCAVVATDKVAVPSVIVDVVSGKSGPRLPKDKVTLALPATVTVICATYSASGVAAPN